MQDVDGDRPDAVLARVPERIVRNKGNIYIFIYLFKCVLYIFKRADRMTPRAFDCKNKQPDVLLAGVSIVPR